MGLQIIREEMLDLYSNANYNSFQTSCPDHGFRWTLRTEHMADKVSPGTDNTLEVYVICLHEIGPDDTVRRSK